MRRCSHFLVLLFILATLGMTGCGDDSPTAPAGGGGSFSLTEHFTPEEAVVSEREADATLRMVGVQFATSTADLTAASLPVLDKFQRVFAELPGATFSIEGHTDERGSSSYNQRISEERALSVRRHLIEELGGSAEAISAIGYGDDRITALDSSR